MIPAQTVFASVEGSTIALVIMAVVLFALVIRLGAGSMDDGRIREHVLQKGGKLRSIHWSPFGRGWFGSKNERIYEVVYEDERGDVHRAFCKTSALAGVYWTEDTVTERSSGPAPTSDAEKLAAEN